MKNAIAIGLLLTVILVIILSRNAQAAAPSDGSQQLPGARQVNEERPNGERPIIPPWIFSREPVEEFDSLPRGWDLFPLLPFFRPLFADLREPRTELSLTSLDLATPDPTGGDRVSGFAFIGDNFTLLQHTWSPEGPGVSERTDWWELGLQGMVNGEVPFADDTPYGQAGLRGTLINVDFTLGPTFSLAWGRFSVRLRYYHQSSHLGDELLLRRPTFAVEAYRATPVPINRLNLSYETLEAIVSYAWRSWRFYGGGASKVRIDPNNIKRGEFHLGMEFHPHWQLFHIGRVVAGYDLKFFEYHDWAPEHSVQVGLELGPGIPDKRNFKLLFEYCNGHNPTGQFFLDVRRIQSYGFGLRFSL